MSPSIFAPLAPWRKVLRALELLSSAASASMPFPVRSVRRRSSAEAGAPQQERRPGFAVRHPDPVVEFHLIDETDHFPHIDGLTEETERPAAAGGRFVRATGRDRNRPRARAGHVLFARRILQSNPSPHTRPVAFSYTSRAASALRRRARRAVHRLHGES
jgi:hypothetical protein